MMPRQMPVSKPATTNSSWEVMILRASFTGGADSAFLRKYAGIRHPIRPRCETRLAQEFSKSNRSCDIATCLTINRSKSQQALPLFYNYYYLFIYCCCHLGVNSRKF